MNYHAKKRVFRRATTTKTKMVGNGIKNNHKKSGCSTLYRNFTNFICIFVRNSDIDDLNIEMESNQQRESWLRNIFRKRRISINNPATNEESWYAHLSPMAMVTSGIAIVAIIFGILLLVVAYTPILDIMPGYRTDASKSRETLIRNLIRIDSLERKMNEVLAYNESRILVVEGKTPTMRSKINDSLSYSKKIIAPSRADSLFRRQMENDKNYALRSDAAVQRTVVNAIKPMEGIIAERFNAKVGLFGVRMVGGAETQILATAEGTIATVDWLPDADNCITIQHDNGMISIYRRLSSVIVGKGQRVAAGEVIGYSAPEDRPDDMFEFELWSNGKPLNPESYILF